MIGLEWHEWMGFERGRSDLILRYWRLGFFTLFYDDVPLTNTLNYLRSQLRALRRDLERRDDVPGSTDTRD